MTTFAPTAVTSINQTSVPPGLNQGPTTTPASTDNANSNYSGSYLGWLPTPTSTNPNLKTYYFKITNSDPMEWAGAATPFHDDTANESGFFIALNSVAPGMGGDTEYYQLEYDQSNTTEVTIKIGGTNADDKNNTKFKFTKGTAK